MLVVVAIEAVRKWLAQMIWRQRHLARAGTEAPAVEAAAEIEARLCARVDANEQRGSGATARPSRK